ncbi:hypothetical protein [Acidovorax sp.]|uniref:hypothetical protein n=1 Tax=Acidovorax sp. TaxID=1872122 RepID=UPI002ACDDCB1|nr:hypothetical protein [Acidovorax sp.]MDZ7861563.1 hypothetical protein [Acidovorax sp.]
MNFGHTTRALWLRSRQREGQFEAEACLLAYDDESFSDIAVSGDIKAVFEKRASTANVFIVTPFLSIEESRNALRSGHAVQRAASYISGKSGNVYLIELSISENGENFVVGACPLTWDVASDEVSFGRSVSLSASLCEGWLFDLFDANEGLVTAPAGVHFRKSSFKHTDTFLRSANALTSSVACGVFAMLALVNVGCLSPKRIFVDTAPLLSLAFALMRVARAHGMWKSDVPARSFGSYGGLKKIGRLSEGDIVLVSATTSGSLAKDIERMGAKPHRVVTLYFLKGHDAVAPNGILCDLTIAPEKSFGYQPILNFPANDCPLCKQEYLLAELEGDQFLLQQRQQRLLRVMKKTQSSDARKVLTELQSCGAFEVILRTEVGHRAPVQIKEGKVLSHGEIRSDFIRLLRRHSPQPLALVVRVNISDEELRSIIEDAGLELAFANAKIIDWLEVGNQNPLAKGAAVLVIFGCLSSHTQARSVNASLRAVVDDGNVSYVSAITFATNPEQYQDLKMFLSYGERGLETFTFRDARRIAMPGGFGSNNSWEAELDLLDQIAASQQDPDISVRREMLSLQSSAREGIFLPGKNAPLKIQRDFVYLDTSLGVDGIAQADVFSVVLNLLCVARSLDRELLTKATPGEPTELIQSLYGHVLLSPDIFEKYNDAILKACFLRAARPSELMYEVDEGLSTQMTEIILFELTAWEAATGDALPEMLLAIATNRLRLRDMDRIKIREEALKVQLPPMLNALAKSISK